ncbi:MAG: ribosome-binding factor A, partial [Actinomycetota bacterium]|nr:ribosome-binding factor A [Actinomycetota bacterium]
QTGIKYVPTLTFVTDAVPKTAQDIEDALARAAEIDAQVAAKRDGATFAGDPDPYRQPRVDDSEGDEGDEGDEDSGR